MNFNDLFDSAEMKIPLLFEYQSSLLKILENRYLTQDIRREIELRLLNVNTRIEEELSILPADPQKEEA